ncbi:hypothetical protein D3C79_788080 [compost metagenome]
MLTPTVNWWPSIWNGGQIASIRRFAVLQAASRPSRPVSTTANSSPPKRARVSCSRSSRRRRLPRARNSLSPKAWPRESLMFLKLSRSRHSAAVSFSLCWPRTSACLSRSLNSVRLGKPVSASWCAMWWIWAWAASSSVASSATNNT